MYIKTNALHKVSMVTFSCEVCNESMLKKKADQHTQRCYGAYFTCIDCSTTFSGGEYRQHTQCITEDEKYQKALYRGKKKPQQTQQQQQQKQQQKQQKQQQQQEQPSKERQPESEPAKVEEKKDKKDDKKPKTVKSKVSKIDLKEHKGKGLYKVLKNLNKDEKKDLLKRIVISKEGKLELK